MILYERIRKLTFIHDTTDMLNRYCRIWIQDDGDPDYWFDQIAGQMQEQIALWIHLSIKDLARQILYSQIKINAIEIIDVNDSGVVLYRDWP